VVNWTLVYTTQAKRDAKKLTRSGLKPQAEKLLALLAHNPYQTPPPYEKLVGDLAGACSRRINIQHRLVYQVLHDIKTVKVIRMWTHYE
jgi:Txe/YoeB family toxin of toxin-antitoxin system